VTAIRRFQYDDGTHSPLSNFYVSPFELDDYAWQTVEHYFQATKSSNPVGYHQVREAATPGEAKRLGRRVTLRADWEQVKLDVMRGALAAKFAKDSELAEWLLSTGDALLVEGNTWSDIFWGVCNGVGSNWLGGLLMMRRAELRSEEKM
jgi:ribA/ribD-fused uncharacterized protein